MPVVAVDNYPSGNSLTTSFERLENVSPSDTDELTEVSRGLYVGVAGDVAVVLKNGTAITLALAAGWHPIRVRQVLATDTTATGLIAGA